MRYLLLFFLPLFIDGCNYLADNSHDHELGKTNVSTALSNANVKIPNYTLSPKEYKTWVQKYCKLEKKEGNILYELLLKPSDYVVCTESSNEAITQQEQKKLLSEIDGVKYFDLRITLDSEGHDLIRYRLLKDEDYDLRIKYYDFQFQNDICLIDSRNDTVHAVLYHFENNSQITPYNTISIGFPSDHIKATEIYSLQIHNKALLAPIDTVSFKIPGIRFFQFPQLKTI